MKLRLASPCVVALILFTMSLNVVYCDEVLVDENVTLYGSGDPLTRIKTWNLPLEGGNAVSISVSVQTGDPVDFEIFPKDSSNNKLLEKNGVTSVEEQWTAPNSDTFTFWVEGSLGGRDAYGSATLHVTIQKTAGQGGGGFDPLPAVVVLIFVCIGAFAALVIFRMRKQPSLPPPPPPPPPDQLMAMALLQL